MVAVSIKDFQGTEKKLVQPDFSALSCLLCSKEKDGKDRPEKIISLGYGPVEKW